MPEKNKRVVLTKTMVDAAEPGEGGRRVYIWDATVPGLGVRVGARDKVFIVGWRNTDGVQRRETIGTYGAVTLDAARRAARKKLGEVAGGADPLAEKRKARSGPTVAQVADRFERDHIVGKRLKPSTATEYRRILAREILPRWGGRPIKSLSREDISEMHASMAARPYMANHALRLVRVLWRRADEWYDLNVADPTARVRPYEERERHRPLAQLELRRVARELRRAETADPGELVDADGRLERVRIWRPALDCLRVLLLTGLRKREVTLLRWEWVDVDAATIRYPNAKTGPRLVFVCPEAMAIIDSQPRTASPFVFDSARGMNITGTVDRAWVSIRRRAHVEGARIHDLRHGVGQAAVEAGLSDVAISQVLGDRDPSSLRRYGRMGEAGVRKATRAATRKIAAALKTEGAR